MLGGREPVVDIDELPLGLVRLERGGGKERKTRRHISPQFMVILVDSQQAAFPA